MRNNRLTSILLFLGAFAALGGLAFAQTPSTLPGDFGQPGLEGLGGLAGIGQSGGDPVKVEAHIETDSGSRRGRLLVTATIEDTYHIYSNTQPKGGPQRTKIDTKPSQSYRRIGDFETTTPPKAHVDDGPWKGLVIEEHEGKAQWVAPIEIAAGTSVEDLFIEGTVDLQACDPSICIPLLLKFTARHDASAAPPTAPSRETPAPLAGPTFQGSYAREGSQSRLSGHLEPAAVAPGGETKLVLTITPGPGWHAYALTDLDPQKGNKPTLIVLESTGGLTAGEPSADAPIIEQEPDEVLKRIGWPTIRFYDGPVTFTIPIKVPAGTPAGPRVISGIVGFQICQKDGQCELPQAAHFQVTLQVDPGATAASGAEPLTFAAAEYADAAKAAVRRAERAPANPPDVPRSPGGETGPAPPEAGSSEPLGSTSDGSGYDLSKLELREVTLTTSAADAEAIASNANSSLTYYLAIAFVGGLILNLMPCVLPVIGLKVMSFVQQAGHSRSQAFALNIWYSVGIVIVFLALAGLAVGAGLGWGDQFSSVWFNAALASLVFAMALSMLGVWEIPIPGFVGGSTASHLAEKEGATGAFTKGVITTVLATPCTGPFMASALGWAVQQPAATTFATFGAMGLGMASPYLVMGAFPSLVRFLPKPGNWMVTFKQVMGFVLLGTVVFILSFMSPASIVPTVALLAGIGLACWWTARVPVTADFDRKLRGWLVAAGIVGASAWVSFGWLYQRVFEPRLAEKQRMQEDERVRGELAAVLRTLRSAEGEEAIAAASALVQQRLALIDSVDYQAFSLSKLQRFASEEGRTVLVDFTADWCATCKVFEATVLHSEPVEKALADQEVVTMKADYTDKPEHLTRVLRALDSNGVPVIAIFPGNDPYRPYVFKGGYTQDGILTALRQAEEASPPSAVADTNDGELVASTQQP